MEAEMYAGNGKIYSKRVPLDDVAWIDPTQGQYAPIREFPRPVIKDEEISISREIPPYKESNFYKQRQKPLQQEEQKAPDAVCSFYSLLSFYFLNLFFQMMCSFSYKKYIV